MIEAVVFDMDGVLVDSESQWKSLEAAYFRRLAPGWGPEHDERSVGLGVEDLHRFLVSEFGVGISLSEFVAHCDETAREVYERRVVLTPGFVELARGLRARGVKTALASSSPARWVELVTRRFALSPLLDAVAAADDAGGKTKPFPDLYLLALSRVGVSPARALAVEDSEIGLLAARRAGMVCAAFRNGANAGQDLSAADFELAGFSGLDAQALLSRAERA